MADQQPNTGSSAKDIAASVGAELTWTPTAKKDPLDRTTAESRYVYINGRQVLRTPLGVEPGYTAPYVNQRMTGDETSGGMIPEGATNWGMGVAPRYDASDLDLFAGLSGESLASLQASLARAGLLSKYPKGIFTSETQNALGKILVYANQRGLLWQDALEEWATAGDEAGLGGSGAKGPVFTPRLSNPDDLRKVFKQVAFNTMGGNFLSDDDYQRMVAQYQGRELAAQRQQFDVAIGGGGETVEAPQAQTYAADTLETEQTSGVQAHSIMQYGKVLESLLGGG